jgi:hypothetical protein
MGIVNRRNAVVGWLTLTAAKRVVKKKAKDVVPSVDLQTKKPNKSALALLVASVVGVATFWRRRSGDDGKPDAAG